MKKITDKEIITSKRYVFKSINIWLIIVVIYICFGWTLLIALGVVLRLPVEISVALLVVFGIILPSSYGCMIFPKQCTKYLKQRLIKRGFEADYIQEWQGNYCLIDKNKGRIAVITRGCLFETQIREITSLDRAERFSDNYMGRDGQIYLVGVKLWIDNKKYIICTYCGSGRRHTITLDKNQAQPYILEAERLAKVINELRKPFLVREHFI